MEEPGYSQNAVKKTFNKRFVMVAIIFLIIVAGGLLIYFLFQPQKASAPESETATQERNLSTSVSKGLDITVKEVDLNKLPKGIPSNIPLEKNVLITENDIVTSPDKAGVTQYTRKFVSKKSLKENYSIYKTYLRNNGWTILSSLEKENLSSLFAANSDGSKQMLITISKNSTTGEVTVDLTTMTSQ